MNEIIINTIYYMLGVVVCIGFLFFSLNFMMRGLIAKFFAVKSSQGKKILIRCKTKTDYYYNVGTHFNQGIKYKDRTKTERIISNVPEGAIYSIMTVFCIDYDEQNDCFWIPESRGVMKPVDSFSSDVVDNIYMSVLTRPTVRDIIVMMCIVIIVLLFIAIGIEWYYGYKIFEAVTNLPTVGVISGVAA